LSIFFHFSFSFGENVYIWLSSQACVLFIFSLLKKKPQQNIGCRVSFLRLFSQSLLYTEEERPESEILEALATV